MLILKVIRTAEWKGSIVLTPDLSGHARKGLGKPCAEMLLLVLVKERVPTQQARGSHLYDMSSVEAFARFLIGKNLIA